MIVRMIDILQRLRTLTRQCPYKSFNASKMSRTTHTHTQNVSQNIWHQIPQHGKPDIYEIMGAKQKDEIAEIKCKFLFLEIQSMIKSLHKNSCSYFKIHAKEGNKRGIECILFVL